MTNTFSSTLRAVSMFGIALVLTATPLLAGATDGFNNPLNSSSITDLVEAFIDVLLQVGAVVVVLFFIYAGFQFVTANGNPGKIETAKRAATYCIIGGLILLGAKVIVEVISSTVEEL